MNSFNAAIEHAARGLSWTDPCLLWVADFIRGETGRDPGAEWRGIDWTETATRRELLRLAQTGEGATPVERALDTLARREGWLRAECAMQGALLIGVYTLGAADGAPSIFDGWRRWLVSHLGGGCSILPNLPDRIWEVPRA